VSQASANVAELFNRPVETILGSPLATLFTPDGTASIDALEPSASLRELCPLHLESRTGIRLEATVHRSGQVVVVELERRSSAGTHAFDPRMRQAIVKLQRATNVVELSRVAAEEVRSLTGFDRVMVYRFDPDWNGEVVAEAKRAELEPFLGLHYPASDIPAQARRLYTQNWLRLIGDVAYVPVPLVPTLDPETNAPLDLSHAHLRSVSPIHIEYLRNMGVRASMSISLVADGQLIGLIACHHYDGPKVVDYTLRETSEYIGQALSWNVHVLERADDAERAARVLAAESEVATSLAAADDLLSGLATPALLALTDAAGAAIVLDEGVRCLGTTPDERRIGEIVAWLRMQRQDVFATDQLASHYGPAEHWDGATAGLLATALSHDLGEYLLWFRPSTERSVDWAGDPRKQLDPGDGAAPPRLSPRGSFELWRETVRGKALPWARWQIESASNIRRLLVGGARRRAAALRLLNQRLVDADRAKDTFIATVSHELRNPLNSIQGWSRLLTAGGLPPEKHDEAIQVIARNADALARLVDDLLDMSRIVSGKLVLDTGSVDLTAVVEGAIEMMALAADTKSIRIKRVLGSSAMTVIGDAARIRQVVTNLLSNAIKFTPKNGSIHVSLGQEGSDLEVAVRDSGRGIERDFLPRLFDPFSQADNTPGKKATGLGLGLAICKKLVELHGGRITAESEGAGKGATFRMRLPIAPAQGTSRPTPVPAGAPRSQSLLLAGARVLVVEDERDSRELMRHLLEAAGAVVSTAEDGPSGLEQLDTSTFDVLVSDIGMPGMDGLAMMTALRAKTGHPAARIPAVALTAYVRAWDRTAALRAGFQAHVPKPADPEELVTVLASLLGRI
jgi:light-regulated signal transduction histidine kinase (bacteriophytochrome)/ActR/RegA family two-component response regulator